jgi:alpha-beta hydrolase superfamily lysophospholipase
MKRTTLSIAALAVCFSFFLSIPASADYHVVSIAKRRVGSLLVTEKTVQAGDDPAARFTVHRMRKSHGPSRGVLLLMPGGASNFAFYTADEDGREIQSFAAYFAARGIEVWGYSPRTQGLAPGACSGPVDCSGMSEWGMQSVVDDALYIREQIRAIHGEEKPVIAGLSLGAMTPLAVLNASPDDWAGAVLWEGMIYSEGVTTSIF